MKGKRRTMLAIVGIVVNLGAAKYFGLTTEQAIWMIVLEAVIIAFAADWIYKNIK